MNFEDALNPEAIDALLESVDPEVKDLLERLMS